MNLTQGLHVHIIAQHLPPTPGGLGNWTVSFANKLSDAGCAVDIYQWGSPASEAPQKLSQEIRLHAIGFERSRWDEPLRGGGVSFLKLHNETTRINCLIIRRIIDRKLNSEREARHIIVSNFATGSGFIGACLSEDLLIPHIACIVGTDCSRGLYVPSEREILSFVVGSAEAVVTFNLTHNGQLSRAFQGSNIKTIYPTLELDKVEIVPKRPKRGGRTEIFSDCGYSSKKGTQVLVEAYLQAKELGYDVSLTICGAMETAESRYWEDRRRAWGGTIPDLKLLDHLNREAVTKILSASDLYCSATLGEGCSAARMAALCMGIPIVTTKTGEMLDFDLVGLPVWLANPADHQDFLEKLKWFLDGGPFGGSDDNGSKLDSLRDFLTDPHREVSQWLPLLRGWS